MNFFTLLMIKIIKVYKFLISPLFGNSCRFLPTCSEYSIDALKTHGFFKGLVLSLKRVLSCNPWGNSGFDPVKKESKIKK